MNHPPACPRCAQYAELERRITQARSLLTAPGVASARESLALAVLSGEIRSPERRAD